MREVMTRQSYFRGDNLPVGFSYEEVQEFPELIKVLNSLAENLTKIGSSKTKVKEIKSLTNNIKLMHSQYLRNETFIHNVKIVVYDSSLSTSSKTELEEVMLADGLANYCHLGSGDIPISKYGKSKFFGLNEPVMSGSNTNSFQNSTGSSSKMNSLNSWKRTSYEEARSFSGSKTQSFEDLDTSISSSEISQEKLDVLKINTELHEQVKQHHAALVNCVNPLNEAMYIRCDFVKSVDLKTGTLLVKKKKLYGNKIEILQLQMLLSHLVGDPNVMKALHLSQEIVMNELSKKKQEILEIRHRLNSYENHCGAAFEKVLDEYRNVLESIESKKWLLKKLEKPEF